MHVSKVAVFLLLVWGAVASTTTPHAHATTISVPGDSPVDAQTASRCHKGACPYLLDLYKGDREFRVAAERLLNEAPIKKPGWFPNGVESPILPIRFHDSDFIISSVCEPHNCVPSAFIAVLYRLGDKHMTLLYGYQSPHDPNILDAKTKLLGNPDKLEQEILMHYWDIEDQGNKSKTLPLVVNLPLEHKTEQPTLKAGWEYLDTPGVCSPRNTHSTVDLDINRKEMRAVTGADIVGNCYEVYIVVHQWLNAKMALGERVVPIGSGPGAIILPSGSINTLIDLPEKADKRFSGAMAFIGVAVGEGDYDYITTDGRFRRVHRLRLVIAKTGPLDAEDFKK
jgi:hypothetical protein